MVDLSWDTEYGFFVFAISATLLGYYSYYYISHSEAVRSYFSKKFLGDSFWISWVLFQKFAGFFFMAFFPAIIYLVFFQGQLSDFGLTLYHVRNYWVWLVSIPLLLIVINMFLSRSTGLMQQYPQMRINRWSMETFGLSAIGWSAYLVAYEYLFRGLLLFSSYEAFGLWPAVAINVSIYSAVHMPKGIGETLGAIPYGILSCLLTLITGTILIPVVAHISLAVSMEFFAIRHNPEMKLIKINRKDRAK